ncbi:hypothetical protein OKW28_007105 [Paraburkholderia sp. 40]
MLIIQNGIETVRKFQDCAGPTASRSARHSHERVLDKTKEAGVDGERVPFWALMAVGLTWIAYCGDRRRSIPDYGDAAAA